jgi:hypothetical protein
MAHHASAPPPSQAAIRTPARAARRWAPGAAGKVNGSDNRGVAICDMYARVSGCGVAGIDGQNEKGHSKR